MFGESQAISLQVQVLPRNDTCMMMFAQFILCRTLKCSRNIAHPAVSFFKVSGSGMVKGRVDLLPRPCSEVDKRYRKSSLAHSKAESCSWKILFLEERSESTVVSASLVTIMSPATFCTYCKSQAEERISKGIEYEDGNRG